MQMIFRSYTRLFVPAVFTLISFGLSSSALAHTTCFFKATYNSDLINLRTSLPNVFDTNITGESIDAPDGLTNLKLETYNTFDPATGVFISNPDPTALGLEGVPFNYTVTLFGNGKDKIFGINSDVTTIDIENLVGTGSGTLTIIGGEGRFRGVTGVLKITESDILSSQDPTAPVTAKLSFSGFFQTPKRCPRLKPTKY